MRVVLWWEELGLVGAWDSVTTQMKRGGEGLRLVLGPGRSSVLGALSQSSRSGHFTRGQSPLRAKVHNSDLKARRVKGP